MTSEVGSPWPSVVRDILGGDLVTALGYRTRRGGTVVLPVSTMGMFDEAAGTVSFTTPFAGYKKLVRLEQDGRVALAFHAREHGSSQAKDFVLVQGNAVIDPEPDQAFLDWLYRERWPRYAPPRKRGVGWDRLAGHYYDERVAIHIAVHRITVWPQPDVVGEVVVGPPLASAPAPSQQPQLGAGPRVASRRYRRRLAKSRHVLVGWVDGDGYPTIQPTAWTWDGEWLRLAPSRPIPGHRRAGLLGHWFGPRMLPQGSAVLTGWLAEDGVSYAPHSVAGYTTPATAWLATLGTGLSTKPMHRRALREGFVVDGKWRPPGPVTARQDG